MSVYHKIQTVYLRDPETKHKTLLDGQWAMSEFGYLAGLQWEWTEKIDGMNIRIIWKDGKLDFRGKTDNAQMPGPLGRELEEIFGDNKALRELGDDVLLYGEGYGAGIQRGGCYRSGPSFILFDVVIGDFWLRRTDVYNIANKLGISATPVIGTGPLVDAVTVVKNGLGSKISRCPAEGLVMRPLIDLYNRRGERIIAKIKGKDFVGGS